MFLFPIGFFYACFMVASKRIAAVAAQGKCSFPSFKLTLHAAFGAIPPAGLQFRPGIGT